MRPFQRARLGNRAAHAVLPPGVLAPRVAHQLAASPVTAASPCARTPSPASAEAPLELEVASVRFALPAALPAEPDHRFRLKADGLLRNRLGTYRAKIHVLSDDDGGSYSDGGSDDDDGDWWVGVTLEPVRPVPLSAEADREAIRGSIHLAAGPPAAAAAGAGGAGWLRGWQTTAPRFKGVFVHWHKGVKLSELRAAAAAGHELRCVLALCKPGAARLGPGAGLRVPPPPAGGGLSAELRLGGPLSDVTVTCGGARFAAHRAALAAASPVLNTMVSAGAAEVAIQQAEPATIELLLRHTYGAPVDVPLSLAPQLCGLASRLQLHTNLAEQLTLWLSSVDLNPAALCELLPAAAAMCPHALQVHLMYHALESISEIAALPGFGRWPLEAVAFVVAHLGPVGGFEAAAAWMATQPQHADLRARWAELLGAVAWGRASHEELRAIRDSPRAAEAPGLQERLLDAYHGRCCRLAAKLEGLDLGEGPSDEECSEGE